MEPYRENIGTIILTINIIKTMPMKIIRIGSIRFINFEVIKSISV